jgi:hypothetical protein
MKSGDLFRVDYVNKREWSLDVEQFNGFQILETHPLLEHYNQEWMTIYLAGSADDPYRMISRIQETLLDHFKSWRGDCSYRYDYLVEVLSSGWGILYEGPSEAVSLVVDILDSEMIGHSCLNSRRPPSEAKLLLMGRNYVVADDFRISRVD